VILKPGNWTRIMGFTYSIRIHIRRRGARGLAEEHDLGRVAAEVGDVVVDPFDGQSLYAFQ